MRRLYSWPWVEEQVAQTIDVWNGSAVQTMPGGRRYSLQEQQRREAAYDEGLLAVEREIKKAPRNRTDRLKVQERIVALFARFSAVALDLEEPAVSILTNEFLPVGTQLARWARQFDARLSIEEIIQACRNGWTACGLQPLFGERMSMTPSILGYSLLYPYSDNYLDREDISSTAKLQFSAHFCSRLRGEMLPVQNDREAALWKLVALIEEQYPRERYQNVFDCLLAIHRAQEGSIQQLTDCDDLELLRVSCAKGGSSVLADACLARGWLKEEENRFAFEWGVLLQLGDDLQDVHEDMRRGSVTLFSRAAMQGKSLDNLAKQLLNFSERVGVRMDQLPHGTPVLKNLLKMSWRSLILRAVADSHEFFSQAFVQEAEHCSPFRFEFLRARQKSLTGKEGLYAMLFDVFLENGKEDDWRLHGYPSPVRSYSVE